MSGHGHKFNPENAELLENPKRKQMLSPDKLLEDIKPGRNQIWADIGCGSGFFAIPLSRIVKEVLALDISSELLELLEQKVTENTLKNIRIVKSEENLIPLENESVDGVFMAFVAHELAEPGVFLKEVKRILKPGGRLSIVEFAKVPSSWGPPLEHRLTPEQMDSWALEAGLKKSNSWDWPNDIVGWEYLV